MIILCKFIFCAVNIYENKIMANTAVLNQFGFIPFDTAALKAALDD